MGSSQKVRNANYEEGSLTLFGTVAMGTGVMIGAGVFALTGQIAELSGPLFPLAFLAAAVISGFSAYSYVVVSRKYPSAGGIGMILKRAYGRHPVTGAAALMMALSMVINESLVARTFGTYLVRPFGGGADSPWVPGLALALVVASFLVNIAGNTVIDRLSKVTAALKVGGILAIAAAGLWASGLGFQAAEKGWTADTSPGGFIAGVALAILAYKGFTTITNSGDEVVEPETNVGRAIVVSLVVCAVVYLVVAWAVGSSLTIEQIVGARDYSLAEAARPAIGEVGVGLTVAIAVVATASGIVASMFAVSRMLAMLSEMTLIPHRHFGMPGDVQRHTLVYVSVVAGLLALFLDLGRIASMGAILYLVMDMTIHWGVLTRLRDDVGAHPAVVGTALALDAVVLVAFVVLKARRDPLILAVALATILALGGLEWWFLRSDDAAEPVGEEQARAGD